MKWSSEMIDLDKEDMDAVERAFADEERAERMLDMLSCVLTVVGAIVFLALCWLLIRSRESADAERRARDPQGAAARVERRLMAEDAAYRLCRRASGAVFALPKEESR